MRYLVVNTKNYPEISGKKLDKLAKITNSLSKQKKYLHNLEFTLAVPAFCIESVAASYPSLSVIAQHLDDMSLGASTGFLIPELAKSFGAKGSLVNHSEHRVDRAQIEKLVERMRQLKMVSIICARDDSEVGQYSKFAPDFIAIEPPELIGSGVAVSKAKPEVITNSRRVLDDSKPEGSKTKLLCGAGIVDGLDSRLAVELGSEGILVASGVIKAPDWKAKISELAEGIISAKER